MKDRAILLLYGALVVAGTLVQDPRWLAAAGIVVLASSGRRLPHLAGRVMRATLPFSAAVTLGYLVMARDDLPTAGPVLLRLNLRVLLLSALAFRMLPSLNMQRALGFSPTLRFVLVLATSQMLTFRRLFHDFRQALSTRSPRPAGLLVSLRHGAATAAWFLRRAEHDATEMTQALEARGFFLDRD